MDAELRCNNVQCRKGLGSNAKACVTTCSHIFCVDCAEKAFTTALVCPACESCLTEGDDIVFTELNPTEDYKSSVLAGLRPEVIIEIASRGLSFWVYQVTQEGCFQEMVYKNLSEKYSQLERQVQTVVREANQEIQGLREKLSVLQKDQEVEKLRNHELAEQYAEKGRHFQKLQHMYDKLKRRSLLGQQQHSTNNAAASVQQNVPAPAFGHPNPKFPVLNGSNMNMAGLASALEGGGGQGYQRPSMSAQNSLHHQAPRPLHINRGAPSAGNAPIFQPNRQILTASILNNAPTNMGGLAQPGLPHRNGPPMNHSMNRPITPSLSRNMPPDFIGFGSGPGSANRPRQNSVPRSPDDGDRMNGAYQWGSH